MSAYGKRGRSGYPVSDLYFPRAAMRPAGRPGSGGPMRFQRPSYAGRRRYAARAAALNTRTGGFLGIETKFYDTGKAASAIVAPTDAAGAEQDPATVDCISAPAQGDTEQSRDGNRIMIKSAQVTGLIDYPEQDAQTSPDGAPTVAVYMVLDKQANGATLNSEDVFANPSASALTAATPLRNLQYSTRFRVLAKTEVVMPQPQVTYNGTNLDQGAAQVPFRLDFTGNIPVQFKGGATAAGVAGVADNAIHIIAFASSSSISTRLSYNARIRFVG